MNEEEKAVFECRKCGQTIYVKLNKRWQTKLMKFDCPSCGEEPDGNWIYQCKG